jgi:hypothetical protein
MHCHQRKVWLAPWFIVELRTRSSGTRSVNDGRGIANARETERGKDRAYQLSSLSLRISRGFIVIVALQQTSTPVGHPAVMQFSRIRRMLLAARR